MKRLKLPKTRFGFPIDPAGRAQADQTHSSPNHPKNGEKGIALIIAIMIISVMMLFTSDLILSSQVNMKVAVSHRDNIKAEYMAKSGLNAAVFLITTDFAYDLFQASQNPKGGLSDGLGDIWSGMNGLPIGGETADMMKQFQEGFGLSNVLDSGILDQLKLFDGQFIIDVTDEQQKINVNYCSQGRCSETLLMLEGLFSCPAEKAFLDAKKVSPKELAYRIKDWVDTDSKAEEASGFNDEDEPYRKREPQVRAKNAPFDTPEELRMIEGWDEEVQAVFDPYLTIFPFQQKGTDHAQININTASRALLACLFPESKGDCSETSTMALKKRNEDKASLGGDGKKMTDILRDTLCYNGGEGNAGEATNRVNWFTQTSMVFRVVVKGEVGETERTVTAVVERFMPDVKKGEKASYRVLYWKLN